MLFNFQRSENEGLNQGVGGFNLPERGIDAAERLEPGAVPAAGRHRQDEAERDAACR